MLSPAVLATLMGMPLFTIRAMLGSSFYVRVSAEKEDKAADGDDRCNLAHATLAGWTHRPTMLHSSFYILDRGGGTDDL